MIEIAIGAKVLVTQKIDTDLDVMNGAQGKSVDIVLHPDKPPFEGGPIVKLKYLLAYILFKMERIQATKLEGLAKGIIPIEPALHCIHISVQMRGHKYVTWTVIWQQFLMTTAYTFTDYHSQGQTIAVVMHVMVDVAKPHRKAQSLMWPCLTAQGDQQHQYSYCRILRTRYSRWKKMTGWRLLFTGKCTYVSSMGIVIVIVWLWVGVGFGND